MTLPDWLFDTDIPWRWRPPLPPIPACDVSTPDVIGLIYADVIALELHVASLQADVQQYRTLAQVSLDKVVQLSELLRQRDAKIAEHREHIRVLLNWKAADDRAAADDDGARGLARGPGDRLPPDGA